MTIQELKLQPLGWRKRSAFEKTVRYGRTVVTVGRLVVEAVSYRFFLERSASFAAIDKRVLQALWRVHSNTTWGKYTNHLSWMLILHP